MHLSVPKNSRPSVLASLHFGSSSLILDSNSRRDAFEQDIYSLSSSSDAVIKFLERVDPDAAGRARKRYGCFDKCDFLIRVSNTSPSCEHGLPVLSHAARA